MLTLRVPSTSLAILIILGLAIAAPAIAIYVEPSSTPPGGRSATFLDTSSNTQVKLGSLVIGDTVNQAALCLNGSDPNGNCITAWSDLGGSVGGALVKVNPDQLVDDPSLIDSYTPYRQTGYAALQGSGGTPAATVIADPAIGVLGTQVGIFATDDLDRGAFAARFSGILSVEQDKNSNPGLLCLNGITKRGKGAGESPSGQCISAWSDLGSITVDPYVKVQTANPPLIQPIAVGGLPVEGGLAWTGTGNGVANAAWQFESVVAGGPMKVSISPIYDNDGLCWPEIQEDQFSFDCQ